MVARFAAPIACVVALLVAACATPASVSPFVGTWQAGGGGEALQLRVSPDGAVEFFVPADGRRFTARAAYGSATGRPGFGGVLPSGEAFSIGPSGGTTMLQIGSRLYALSALPPQRFGAGAAPAAPAAAAGGPGPAPADATGATNATGFAGGDSVAGLRLSTARSANGYFTERTIDFCPNGRVFTRFAELQSSQLGRASGERLDDGTWQQSGGTVRLSLARGGVTTIQVRRTEPRAFRVDGTPYLAEPSPRCR